MQLARRQLVYRPPVHRTCKAADRPAGARVSWQGAGTRRLGGLQHHAPLALLCKLHAALEGSSLCRGNRAKRTAAFRVQKRRLGRLNLLSQ